MFGLMPYRKAERRLAGDREGSFPLMHRDLATLFDRFFGRWPEMSEPEWEEKLYRFEVEEKDKEFVVRAEVPGFEVEEVAVEVSGNVLTIRAEHREPEFEGKEEVPGAAWKRLERSILLPIGVEFDKIEATCRNGVLDIVLPKKPEAMTRKIPVKH